MPQCAYVSEDNWISQFSPSAMWVLLARLSGWVISAPPEPSHQPSICISNYIPNNAVIISPELVITLIVIVIKLIVLLEN